MRPAIYLDGAVVRIDDGKTNDWSDYHDGLTSRRTAGFVFHGMGEVRRLGSGCVTLTPTRGALPLDEFRLYSNSLNRRTFGSCLLTAMHTLTMASENLSGEVE
jgi:hypothetical protein